jgi:hypothetical protein
LYKEGILALEELGIPINMQESELALRKLVENAPKNGKELEALNVPDGPIVSTAFAALCRQYADSIIVTRKPTDDDTEWASVNDIIQNVDGTILMQRFNEQFPSTICQQFMTDVDGVVRDHGLPFIGETFSKDVMQRLGDCEDIWNTIMQMGTVALTLQSVDDQTLDAVENVARDFLALVQSGEMDLSDVQDDPFKLLEKLAASGVADSLMQMLSGDATA